MGITTKRFPANTSMEVITFLNDKTINGELYAILQSYSKPVVLDDGSYRTEVKKRDLPKQSDMCKTLGIASPKTLRVYIKSLRDKGFLIDDEDGYILPEKENMFLPIPLRTIQYLRNNCRDHVFKIYIYLGQRYRFALSQGRNYEFTLEELGEHVGLRVKNNVQGYRVVNDALTLLYNSGLIDYCSFFNGQIQKKKLTMFSLEYKEHEDVVKN